LGFPNLTYIGRVIVNLPFMRGRSLAHEVAHNWWGNGVAVDYRTGNWAEGITTYMSDYALVRNQGPTAAREMRLCWLRDFNAVPEGEAKPVSAFMSRSHQASRIVGYNKVAHVLHMLRKELGDEAFVRGIKDFWAENRFRIAGWSDLQAAFERAGTRGLNRFFEQWLNRAGAPLIEVTDVRVEKAGAQYRLSFILTQVDPAYELNVPVEIETATGIERDLVRVTGMTKKGERALSSKPLSLAIDPDFDLFRRLLPGESPPIIRDVTLVAQVDVAVLETDNDYQSVARALAAQLTRAAVPIKEKNKWAKPSRARIVIGSKTAIADFASRVLEADTSDLIERGSAAAWVNRTAEGHSVLLIRGDRSDSIAALIRPLRHFGNRSYVTSQVSRALTRGVWEMTSSPLIIDQTKPR
jgi:aminopeptidase N